MKAARFDVFGGDVHVVDVPDPGPGRDGVVVEVRATGICRSDWHGWQGHDAMVSLPHVPGHELAGVVVDVGTDVRSVNVGDRVTVPFVLGCGICPQCVAGNSHICDDQYQPGFSGWGAFAEYVALPRADFNVVPLPDTISFPAAAALGCRFATAFRAVVDQGGVAEGSTVAVWGCGGVGVSAVMIASALGAEVIAVDIDDAALDVARRMGAAQVLHAGNDDVVERIRIATSGGVDVSFDALGSRSTLDGSLRSLRKRGRHVQVGLLVEPADSTGIPLWRLHADEIEMYGSHGMPVHRYRDMLDAIGDGTLDPGSLVTETLSLSEGVGHLMGMADFPGTAMVVIDDFRH